ncbi:HlyD family type I secretion periplasmic adaptor subunit [Vibrio astriarenae]|uniref:Membrane fusion protein (MFP) family protein n=1 Tax=Vibrio astriarenae TaxID=1481923 RepID=A0A7Z2T6A2_9VIBR|nr:HlyD family type I secretion periplasmic adaptor subunit [Vibrio astriarenae]QIA65174.1 HlyD family type I secretion periplasmic adaptor subunit [Vibrio astriarenae]
MNKNPIEQHLKNALISSNNPEGSVVDDKVVLSSTMTPVHKTLLVIFLLIIIAVIVASQARIDIVVSVRGELLLDSDIEKVQHLEGGILEELLVQKGDLVYEGQPIAQLKALERNSQLDTVNTELVQLELDIIRYQSLLDMAEPDFSPYQERFPELVSTNLNTWRQEFNKNQSNELLITHDIDHKNALISSMKKRRVSSVNQLSLIRKQLEIKDTLYKEEMASYVDVLNVQVQESNMVREIENLDESLMNEDFQLQKLDKQLVDLIENRNAEYQAQIIQAQKDIRIKQLQQPQHSDKVDRLTVYSPIDGVVDKVHFNFKSAIVPPGESIADIAPLNNTLHGEAKIPRKEMGFVEVGQQVKVKLDTYNFAKYGFIQGTITSISRSSYEEEDTQFYLAAIELENNYLERSGAKYNLSPYMEFTADVKTGSRRVIEYAAKPVMSAIEDAFDER